ncbi:helicase [Acidipropionibacterium jensenii]|uniref:helicase n=1 Tax=Acidipropionibacterium jensenii TaxID=1749 RepID=UPI0026498B7C|nr:helicase [Acidipropionibacterium jensenii]MDN6442143.1 helicase [Acidipropionibacterium jensenii]MDN6480022.1 helicase [Acidipropionibacterium jensenii]MDN6512546.1 helicase [Acidipropionibacterium jensenii]MDN6761470.1 helicase [Acidipropionibacterium jensenii]MDN6811852.1 helicase [Acidipropionibacterium jensenii]
MAAVRLLSRLEADDRTATPAEQAVLARWSGWGAAPAIFNESDPSYAAQRAELRDLVGKTGYDAASRTTLNAHYTDPSIDRSMWQALADLGFDGGSVLEPGCGAGTFIGTAPMPVRAVGVELDPTTAKVAAALYPDADIRTESFADTNLPIDSFDAAIGNVPFGDIKLHDPRFNPGTRMSLHDHFIAKSMNLVHPGGTAAFLTSRWTMDKQNPEARRQISEVADLVTAVRLPTGAMRRSAGTDAVVDLLVLRRREPAARPANTDWEFTRPQELDGPGDGERVTEHINAWFADHPEMVMGRQHVQIGMYGRPGLEVDGPLDDLGERLSRTITPAIEAARGRGMGWSPAQTPSVRPAGRFAAPDEQFQEGHIREHDGGFESLRSGMWQPLKVPKTQIGEMRALLEMRDQAVALLTAEAATLDDTPALDAARARLRGSWESYVAQWGPMGRVKVTVSEKVDKDGDPIVKRTFPQAITRFRRDPYGPLVLALEVMDEESGRAEAGPMLRERMIMPRTPVTGVDSIGDAVAVSLDTKGKLDLDYMADLLGTEDATEVEGQLRATDAAFEVPGSEGEWMPAEAYLSGQVRDRLDAAREAAIGDPDRWSRNVEHLEQVLPADLTPSEIEPRVGAPWIPASDYTDFLRSVSGDRHARVLHAGDQWSVDCTNYGVQAYELWGTDRMPVGKLFAQMLGQKLIQVTDHPKGEPARINPLDTEAAQAKAEELQTRFSEWIWEDPERTDRLCAEYNRRFNGLVTRDYTEAGKRLTLPGLAADFKPRPHQLAAVARILDDSSVGLFHEVGAGKTAEMVMGITELKRLGLVHKPLVVVPNHMLEQFSREWLQLYPQARILSAGSNETASLGKKAADPMARRRDLVARAATGDWDAIIMSQGAFKSIPVTPDHEVSYRQGELDMLRHALTEAQTSSKGERDRPAASMVKEVEKAIERAEERMKELADHPRMPGLHFEDMGVDHLTVDELHDFKNLRTVSQISDANIGGKQKTQDLHMKVELLRDQYGKRVFIGATATPISNSVSELYNMTRYIAPEMLEQAGLNTFDQWAATFGEQVSELEVNTVGRLTVKNRFARFTNVPELATMLHSFGDIKTEKDLHLPKPALALNSKGKREPEVVLVPSTPELQAFQVHLGERADRLSAADRQTDNMLKISSDGRHAALDMRLITPGMTPTGETKVGRAADVIADMWAAHRDDRFIDPDTGQESPVTGALQLVFADLGTASGNKEWSAYQGLKDELVDRGMPAASIRFMQDAEKDADKAALFAACRTGRVSVLIGSTQSMGTGVNVQARLIQEVHLDAPWRPADVTQRDGRMMRQGNQNPEVHLVRMVTEGSFDTFMWQTLQRKERFISQIMNADLSKRDMEDIGLTNAEQYGQIKAVASGNPLLMRHAAAERELKKYRRLETAHQRGRQRLEWKIGNLDREIGHAEHLIEDLTPLAAASRDTTGDAFRMRIGAATFTKRAEAGPALAAALQPLRPYAAHDFGVVAQLGGHDITAKWNMSEMQFGFAGTGRGGIQVPEDHIEDLGKMSTITRLENMIRRLPQSIENARTEITAKTTEKQEAQALIGQPFKQADELAQARSEYELVSVLMKAEAGKEPARSEITVDAPEGPGHAPLYTGAIDQAPSILDDGIYRGVDEHGVPVAVHVDSDHVKVTSITDSSDPAPARQPPATAEPAGQAPEAVSTYAGPRDSRQAALAAQGRTRPESRPADPADPGHRTGPADRPGQDRLGPAARTRREPAREADRRPAGRPPMGRDRGYDAPER